MLTQFIEKHPDLVDAKSRTELYARPAGILVRKGNPRELRCYQTWLVKEAWWMSGSGQLGMWEDLAGRAREGLIGAIQRNIAVTVPTSAEAIEKWQSMPQLDARITFESWHYRLKDETELVRLPEAQRLYPGTPIAILAHRRVPSWLRSSSTL